MLNLPQNRKNARDNVPEMFVSCKQQLNVLFSSGLRLNNFVAFILTGYLLSTRMIRNRMCPEMRILINFLLD